MADKEKKGTVYQNLNSFMNLDGMGFDNVQNAEPQAASNKVVIRGNTPEEIHRKGLELEQKKTLQDKFFRTTDRGFQKALQYEAARLPAYIDYEGMEYYPIISSALDLFMEEATTIGTNGKMLNVYSNKDRIKFLLEEFFYNIVNVNVNLPFWTRNLPVKHDSIIPLLNGEAITIKELSERLKESPDKEIWTYSVQEKTNKIVAGKVIWCDLTRKDSDILKVTFDDGTYAETAPDHEYMLRNGTYLRADELKEGISLMPFYTLTSKEAGNILGYEKVYNPSSNHHVFTHRIVAKECIVSTNEELLSGKRFVTHHIDFNKKNNHPSNLRRMTSTDHTNYHMMLGERGKTILQREDVKKNKMLGVDKYLRSNSRKKRLSKEMIGIYPKYFNEYNNSQKHDEHNVVRKNSMLKHWSNDEYREMVKDKMQLKFDDDCLNYVIDILKTSSSYISADKLGVMLASDKNFMKIFKSANNAIRKDLSKSLSSTTLVKIIFRKTQKTYCNFASEINPKFNTESNFKRASAISNVRGNKNCVVNHKVVSIEKMTEKYDTYCMEVVGKNNEQDRHNFPICSKNEDGTYTRNGVFVSNCKYGDNFVLLYGEKKKGITHVKQMVNYEVERFERVQNGKPLVKFKERMTGDEFNVFEIAHFRLLGDDKYLPYGNSVLNKVRRVFRQLVMAEDAMLTYRILRAGEKKVFRIDVGNIDEDDIEEYIYKVATKFKKTSSVSSNDGQIDYRFNIMGNDEDYFLPVRNANTQTGVDTLPGASNLDQIQDIEYLRDNLFIGLGIPKPFLSFQDASGAGKNMAQYDIRFAKKVNRIQQSIIQELNKMAMIHLYLLGYTNEDLTDFTITLTNPSTQQDLLKAELLREKAQTYTELTRGENGIAAMSHTGAKRQLFNMSDREIVEDLKQQKMEKVVMQELADAPVSIKKTGLFADIDKRYAEEGAVVPSSGETNAGMPPVGGGAPPAGNTPTPIAGLPNQTPSELPPIAEYVSYNKPKLSEEEFNVHLEKLVGSKAEITSSLNTIKKRKTLIKENELINSKLNSKADDLVREIDLMINENDTFNKFNSNAINDVNVDVDFTSIDFTEE